MEIRAVTILAAAVASQSVVNAIASYPSSPLIAWLWSVHAAFVTFAIVQTDMYKFKRMS